MRRKPVVGVFGDAVMRRTSLIEGVDVHAHLAEVAHVVQELMAGLCGDGMPLGHRQLWDDSNTHLRLQVMAHPAGPHVRERLHSWDMCGGMSKGVDHLWVHAI